GGRGAAAGTPVAPPVWPGRGRAPGSGRGHWLPLLGGADEAGVVAAQDEGADAAAVFAGGESDEALLEVAGDGAGVAGAGVPGGGGDHLVGGDFAVAECDPVHQGAAGGIGGAGTPGVGGGGGGPRGAGCRGGGVCPG